MDVRNIGTSTNIGSTPKFCSGSVFFGLRTYFRLSLCGVDKRENVRRTAKWPPTKVGSSLLHGGRTNTQHIQTSHFREHGYRFEGWWKTHGSQRAQGSRFQERIREAVGEAFRVSLARSCFHLPDERKLVHLLLYFVIDTDNAFIYISII